MQRDLLPDLLHLFHCFGNARSTLRRLLEAFAFDPRRLRASSPAQLAAAGFDPALARKLRRDCRARIARDLAWAEDPRHHLITCDDPLYPELLRQISDPPLLLYASGKAELLGSPQIAIVGARLCTPGGEQNAREFAAQLATAGLSITSGLALGIDSAAHRGALDVGGNTLAVVACGIDRVYPRQNRELAAEIGARGLLLSEFQLGTPAERHHFPQRNRLISGLSLATLVVEAAARSGSLITARLAAEQGREVFAVPGSIHNPLARGCHQLLREGAMLAESPRDLPAELGQLFEFACKRSAQPAPAGPQRLEREHYRLLEAVGYDPVTFDTLLQRSGLTIDKLSSMLLVLELNDLIQSAPGGCFVRI